MSKNYSITEAQVTGLFRLVHIDLVDEAMAVVKSLPELKPITAEDVTGNMQSDFYDRFTTCGGMTDANLIVSAVNAWIETTGALNE